MSKTPHHQEINTVQLLVKYYEDGLIEWCNPHTGKPYFSRRHPSGKSPIVKMAPPKGIYKPISPSEIRDDGGEYYNNMWKD